MTAPDPVAFTIFGAEIRWYGILIAFAFMIGIFLAVKRAPKFGIEGDTVLDFALWLMPISIIGTRAYYVIFSWDQYADDPMSIFAIRSGGLAIHGGIIAGFLTAVIFCRVRKIRLLDLLDKLDCRERRILEMRFGLRGSRPLTLEEVSQQIGRTRERVRQIQNQALNKLKQLLTDEAGYNAE
jgi:hypothetical protein